MKYMGQLKRGENSLFFGGPVIPEFLDNREKVHSPLPSMTCGQASGHSQLQRAEREGAGGGSASLRSLAGGVPLKHSRACSGNGQAKKTKPPGQVTTHAGGRSFQSSGENRLGRQ